MIERRDGNDLNNEWYTYKNPYYLNGYGIPNCTAYAWGRVSEILGKPINTCRGNAITFAYEPDFNQIYEPVAGAIMVWSGGYYNCGHVAVVEHVYADGSIDISDSSYGGYTFKLTRLSPNNNYFNGDSSLSFEGFYLHKEIFEKIEQEKREIEERKEALRKEFEQTIIEHHPFPELYIEGYQGEGSLLMGAMVMNKTKKSFLKILSKTLGG